MEPRLCVIFNKYLLDLFPFFLRAVAAYCSSSMDAAAAPADARRIERNKREQGRAKVIAAAIQQIKSALRTSNESKQSILEEARRFLEIHSLPATASPALDFRSVFRNQSVGAAFLTPSGIFKECNFAFEQQSGQRQLVHPFAQCVFTRSDVFSVDAIMVSDLFYGARDEGYAKLHRSWPDKKTLPLILRKCGDDILMSIEL